MENKNNNHTDLETDFFWHVLVGSLLTLLVTTKKGRELFKEITEKGLD